MRIMLCAIAQIIKSDTDKKKILAVHARIILCRLLSFLVLPACLFLCFIEGVPFLFLVSQVYCTPVRAILFLKFYEGFVSEKYLPMK